MQIRPASFFSGYPFALCVAKNLVFGHLHYRKFTGDNAWTPIIAGKKPVTVYLCFPEKDLLAKAPVIRLVLESLLSEMIDTFDSTKGHNCRPTLALLDEAGTVGLP